MASPASIRGHPIHPMLVAFPIGLWIFSFVCDVLYHAGSHNLFWKEVAFYSMAGGLIGALLAAVPGFMDYLSLQSRVTGRIATKHMIINLVVVALFLFNLGIRYNASPDTEFVGFFLSVAGIGLMTISGWLGGALVYVHGVAVDTTEAATAEGKEQSGRAA